MCGIAGIYDLRGENRINKLTLEKMMKKILHRGPDGSGTYYDYNLAFGFNRLSLIDYKTGMQPIINEDESIVLICNGEIYNYKELKEKLLQQGHVFKTKTDVEVILHLYEEYQTEFLNKLNGQFAFAIYDRRNKVLFCARDQAGITPFFYTVVNGIFIFSSEIKAILEHEYVSREVDLVAMDQMLTFPGVISPRTMFKNINSLENGHYLYIRHNEVKNVEYWDLDYLHSNEYDRAYTDEYYFNELYDTLSKSVETRLHADVPVGFYISGGIDSSLISYLAAGHIKNDKYSFSINFNDKNFSEAECQKLMVDKLKSIHTQSTIDVNTIAELLRKAVYYSETPLKETYNTASYMLSKSVNTKHIKAVLTGEGADELFGGYVGYKFDKMREKYPLKNKASDEEHRLRHKVFGDENFFYEKNFTDNISMKRNLYSKEINEQFNDINCLNYPIINTRKIQNIDITNKRSYVDFKLRLPEHLLADHGDRMCYANSIEARYPFLDKHVIEFACKVPPDLKLKNYTEKYILKQIAKNKIPDRIVNRPKFAFVAQGSPDLLCLASKESEYIKEVMSYTRIKKNGYFNPDFVLKLMNKYKEPGFRLNLPFDTDWIITMITFELFLEEYNMPRL